MELSKQLLIIGLGNNWLSDDGIGIKLSNDLAKSHNSPDFIYRESYNGGWELLDLIEGYKNVLFIDAIKEKGRHTGETEFLKFPEFKETMHLSHIHDSDFLTSISFGEKTGMALPENMYFFTIQIEDFLNFNKELSPGLLSKYDEILAKLKKIIDTLTF